MTTPEPGRTWAKIVRSERIEVTAGRPTGRATRPTTMFGHWTEEDPAAIVLAIEDPWCAERNVVEWAVARNLLVGAHMPGFAGETVGLGDVRVRYSCGTTTVKFSSAEGAAEIAVPAEFFLNMLREAAQMCPLGEAETAIYNEAIDREYADLCRGANS